MKINKLYLCCISFFSLISCQNDFSNENKLLLEQNKTSIEAQQKAITKFNQFRKEINQSSTRFLPDIDVKSIKSKNYQFKLSIDNNATIKSKSDSIDVYTITFENRGRSGYAILSPDERVGRVYAYTDYGELIDTIDNKGLALHLNGIKNICEKDLISYYKKETNEVITKGILPDQNGIKLHLLI